jgi:peptidoglycan/LPS O-acetylase OafA/YrhL
MCNSAATHERPITNVLLTQGGSLFLDVVRFAAALTVFASHLITPPAHIPLVALGHEAVWVFFVLSGFVIRFITVTRVGTLSEYAIDRISRIYSVVAPALAFTFICEFLIRTIHPGPLQFPFSVRTVLAQSLANLTFTAECWGYELVPASNSPLWSLCFECFYYATYALVYFRIRGGWFWAALLLLVGGPAIAMLAPVWLLGCLTCDLYIAFRSRTNSLRLGVMASAVILLPMALFHRWLGWLMTATDDGHRTPWITQRMASFSLPSWLYVDGVIPWLSRASVGGLLVGLATAAFFLVGLLAMDRYLPSLPPVVTRYVRIIADSTFVLYLFHLPLLLTIEHLRGQSISNHAAQTFAFVCIPLLLIPVARWLDTLKVMLRRILRRNFPTQRHTPSMVP